MDDKEYIEREKVLSVILGQYPEAHYPDWYAQDIREIPKADVVPRSELQNLEYTLLGVMHSVDKWLDGDELEQDEVNRAATMREKTLRLIENAKSEKDMLIKNYSECMKEYARDIFGEIEKCRVVGSCGIHCYFKDEIDELKKKYIEGEQNGLNSSN